MAANDQFIFSILRFMSKLVWDHGTTAENGPPSIYVETAAIQPLPIALQSER
jgi:hypothetical protein